jgi:hypothetical protein
MIVRAVKVDQLIAEALQNGKGRGRSIDKLSIGSGRGEIALYDQFRLVALQPGIFEERGELRQVRSFKNRFYRACFRPGPDQRFVGPFSKEQLEGADDDGFSGSGFARDRGEPGGEVPFKILDQGQVFDPEKAEGSGHFGEAVES